MSKLYHKSFDKLVNYTKAKLDGYSIPINMTGEAGVSKTYSCMQLAEKLGVPFFYIAGSRQLTASGLLGYKSPNGDCIDSQLGEAYGQPSVFVLEEADAVDTNVMMNVNTALSTGLGFFAGRQVKRHPDFIFISTSNTYNGSSKAYNARQTHDASTMSRFLKLKWEHDIDLENAILNDDTLSEYILKLRGEFYERGYDLFMRDVLNFKALLDVGEPIRSAAESTILREIKDGAVVDSLLKLYYPKHDEAKTGYKIKIEWES